MQQPGEAPAVFTAELQREYASTCAFLSYIIYEEDIAEGQWGDQPKLRAHENEPEADDIHWGVFSTDSLLYLCFRGSVTADDWATNFAVKPFNEDGYSFHSGFYTAMHNNFSLLMDHVSQHLGNRKLIVTGHSLGGALAQLFAFMYGRECSKNNANSALECVITFAAPQACNRTPEEHTALRDKCINYACCTDPVPMLPGIVANANAGTIVTNMAGDFSMLANLFENKFTEILTAAGKRKYLREYHAFGHTVTIPNTSDASLQFCDPDAHRSYVTNSDADCKISCHYMLFYLGELFTLELLSNQVAHWFVNRNEAIMRGDYMHLTEYYNCQQRHLLRVEYSWPYILRMVTEPAFIVRALVPISLRRFLRYATVYSIGSEYYFIEASISEDELTSLLKLCYDQVGNDNIQLYRPEDYSWIPDIKDIDLFVRSVRPVSWAERQFGDIHEKGMCIRELNDDEFSNAIKALSEDRDTSSPLRMLANEVLSRRAKITETFKFEDVHSELHMEHRSICAYICYILSVHLDVIKLENAPRLVADNQTKDENDDWKMSLLRWGLYECGNYLYLCFPLHLQDVDMSLIRNVLPLQVNLRDGEYILHCGLWAIAKSAYDAIIKEIAKVRLPNMKLIVTGHSLGGCFAQLFALDLFNSIDKSSPFLEGVITFSAAQTCIQTPPNHIYFEKICINYCCENDHVQFMPGLLQNEVDQNDVAFLDSKKICMILKKYLPLGNAVILPAKDGSNVIEHSTRYDNHKKTQHMAANKFKYTKNFAEPMLFYLGELCTLRLLNPAVNEWFINMNDKYRSGEVAVTKYYNTDERDLSTVKRSCGQIINLIMQPAIVILGRYIDDGSHLILGHCTTQIGYEGKMIAFVDPTASDSDIAAILARASRPTSVYEPGDYSWLEQVNDLVRFVKSYRINNDDNLSDNSIPEIYIDMEKDPKLLMDGNEGVHALLRAMMKTLLPDKEPEITEKNVTHLLQMVKVRQTTGGAERGARYSLGDFLYSQARGEGDSLADFLYSREVMSNPLKLLEKSGATDVLYGQAPQRGERHDTAMRRMENILDGHLKRKLDEKFQVMEKNLLADNLTKKV